MPDVALFIDWENVYYTLRQHHRSHLPSSLAILQAILKKASEYGSVRSKQAIFGQEVAAQDETLLMALEFTGVEPIAVAQRMSGRLLKGRADSVLIVRALRMLYKERPDIETWFIVSGDRDLNALCKALKDEDKHVYLIAGDKSLANELRESPYLRDDVFLLEDLLPEVRPSAAAATSAATREPGPREREPRERGRRGAPGRARVAVTASPGIVAMEAPGSEKEQRRLAVLLLDQLVATGSREMARDEFIDSVVPQSDREGKRALESLVDEGTAQRHVLARAEGRSRAKSKQRLAPNFGSALVAESVFQLVRLLRRIDTVTSKGDRRVPAVEAVLDPLSRADQPGTVQGKAQRRALLETLFSIAEERGAIVSEQVRRDGAQMTMCWLATEHPLARYARRKGASLILLANFMSTVADEDRDWTSASAIPELLGRAEGDGLDLAVRELLDAGALRPDERGARKRAGYVLVRDHPLVVDVLGETEVPSGGGAGPSRQRQTRRGSRGGRGRRRRGARAAPAEEAQEPAYAAAAEDLGRPEGPEKQP